MTISRKAIVLWAGLVFVSFHFASISVSGSQEPLDDDKIRIRKDLQLCLKELQETNAIAPSYRDGTAEFFSLEPMLSSFNNVKFMLIETFSRSGFGALRKYVKEDYPVIELAVVKTRSGPLVPRPAKDRAVSQATAFITKLSHRLCVDCVFGVKFTVEIDVESTPSEAHVEFTADGGENRETYTNSKLPNIYIGKYNYTVDRPGFKQARGQVNLVDEPGDHFECTLVNEKDPGRSFCRHW